MGCVSQDSYPRESILREKGKLGSNRIVNFLQGHMAPQEKIVKEKVHREASFKSVNLTSAIRALPGLRRRHKTKPCIKKIKPAEWQETWRKVSTSSKK